MRLFMLLLLSLFISCNSKEYNLEKLAAAKWEQLEPGIDYIKTRGGEVRANDKVSYTSVGMSVSGFLVKPENEHERQQMNSVSGFLTDVKEKLPCREGFLRVDLNKIASSQKPEIIVYVNDPVDSITVVNDMNWLRNLPAVVNVEYTSKEMARKKFTETSGSEDWERILADNPLPASYDITIKSEYLNTESLQLIKDSIEQHISNINDVRLPESLPRNQKIFCFVRFKIH